MAIDTRQKRDSAQSVGLPWRGSYPVPDGSLAAYADRVQAANLYTVTLTSNLSATPTIDAFTSTATATVLVQAAATPTIDAFTATATGTVLVQAAATPTIGDFTATATGITLVPLSLSATPTIGAFTLSSTLFIGPAEFPKYFIVGRGTDQLLWGQGFGNDLIQGRGTDSLIWGRGFGDKIIKGRGADEYIVVRWERRMSVYQDLEFHLGEHWNIKFEVNDGEGTDIDITSATLQWRLSTISGTTVMTRTAGDGLTITGASTGACTLSVTPTHQTTGSVAAGRYKWEFRVTTTGGTVTVQARGNLNVLPSLY